jgi:hypothetical protein
MNDRAILRNIRSRWDACPASLRRDGRQWYHTAYATLADLAARYDVATDTACAVAAVLSPGCAWDRNIDITREFLHAYPKPVIVGSYGSANCVKARRICEGEPPTAVISGPKVTAFYHSLRTAGLHPTAVTLDRHMYRVAVNRTADDNEIRSRLRLSTYQSLATFFQRTARTVGVTPSILQATLWLSWLHHGVIDTHTTNAVCVAA